MLSPETGPIFPVVVAMVNGVKTRVFLDSGAGNRYVSSALVNRTKPMLSQKMTRQIEMTFSNKTIEVEVYKMQLASHYGSFNMEIE